MQITLNLELLINISMIMGILSLIYFDLSTPVYSQRTRNEYVRSFLYGAFAYPYIASLIAFSLLILTKHIIFGIFKVIYSTLKMTLMYSSGDFDKIEALMKKQFNIDSNNFIEYAYLLNEKKLT